MTAFEIIPAAVVTVAAVVDLRWRRIPNWLTLGALVAGLVLQSVRFGTLGVLIALAGAGLGLALLLPFYVIRAIGAGDVKLLGAVGALVGPHDLVSVAIYTALVGGAISAAMLAGQGRLQQAFGDILVRPRHMTRGGAKAPYGLAIASGVYLSMMLPSVIG